MIRSVRGDWIEIWWKVVLGRQGTHSDPLASLRDSIVIHSVRGVVEGSKLVTSWNRVASVIFGSYCKREGRIRWMVKHLVDAVGFLTRLEGILGESSIRMSRYTF